MISAVGFPPGTIYTVTMITRACPGVVTLSADTEPYSFAIEAGMTVTFSNVKGMYEANGTRAIIGSFDPNEMTVAMYDINGKPINTTNWHAYTSGGEINIISYPSTPGQPPGLMYNNQ